MKNWTGWKKLVSCLRQVSASRLRQQSVGKKSNQIRVCADFSTGLNQALKDHRYPLPSPEEIFNKLNGSKIISKVDYRTHIFKSRWKRILNSFFCLYRKKKTLGRGVLWDHYLPIDELFQILY